VRIRTRTAGRFPVQRQAAVPMGVISRMKCAGASASDMFTIAETRYGLKSASGWRCTGGEYGPGMFWHAAPARPAAQTIAMRPFIPDTIPRSLRIPTNSSPLPSNFIIVVIWEKP